MYKRQAQGIIFMYGPQIDLVTDPRWPRNNGTYGERQDVTAGIITALVDGYQYGTEGVNENSVVLSAKHFPGDGAAENGFESHVSQGQWRLYPTEGSLETVSYTHLDVYKRQIHDIATLCKDVAQQAGITMDDVAAIGVGVPEIGRAHV